MGEVTGIAWTDHTFNPWFVAKADAEAAYASAIRERSNDRRRISRAPRPPAERFRDKCTPTIGGCVVWSGARDKDGYGKFQLNGGGRQKHVRAHRFAFFMAHGRWPAGLVLHSCDNPACVNPDHLSEGTQSENLEQCASRGRRKSVRLTPALVRQIRERHAAGESVTAMAAKMGLKRETLFGVVHRRTWRHVA